MLAAFGDLIRAIIPGGVVIGDVVEIHESSVIIETPFDDFVEISNRDICDVFP